MADLTCLSAAPRAFQLLQQGIDNGLHHGVQVYVSHAGRPLIDDAVGLSSSGTPLSPQHRLPWRSAGKPITAAAILKCCENGTLTLDQPVATVIPAFAAGGKSQITLRHLLTHTALLAPARTNEFPTTPTSIPSTWDAVIQSICETPLKSGWNVDIHAAYEPVRSWFILGEIVQTIERRPYARVIHEDWFARLDMTNCSVAKRESTDPSSTALDSPLYVRTSQGLEPASADTSPFPNPGASFRGPMRELGKFYEMLLRQGVVENVRLLEPDTVADMTNRQRIGRFDETFRHIVDFGLGIICDSNQYGRDTVPYGFGRHCAPRTFGHGGAQTSIAFADPENELVAAVAFNAAAGEPQHQRRMREFLSQLYIDLKVV